MKSITLIFHVNSFIDPVLLLSFIDYLETTQIGKYYQRGDYMCLEISIINFSLITFKDWLEKIRDNNTQPIQVLDDELLKDLSIVEENIITTYPLTESCRLEISDGEVHVILYENDAGLFNNIIVENHVSGGHYFSLVNAIGRADSESPWRIRNIIKAGLVDEDIIKLLISVYKAPF